MKFIKKYLKFLIGIAVLILVLIVFACTMRHETNLEVSTLKDWQRVSLERRVASVRMLTASDDNLELLVQCVDKIATQDGASGMLIRDAVALCNTGIQLKEYM